jgi:hypothetical protein
MNRVEFESYGQGFGISAELVGESSALKDRLSKAKFGRN